MTRELKIKQIHILKFGQVIFADTQRADSYTKYADVKKLEAVCKNRMFQITYRTLGFKGLSHKTSKIQLQLKRTWYVKTCRRKRGMWKLGLSVLLPVFTY